MRLKTLASRTKLCILLSLVFVTPALADWHICNKTPENVVTSIVFDDGQGYVSTGWYKIRACGGCATVYHGMPKLRGAFFHGESEDGVMKWGGTYSFCVMTNRFSLGPRWATDCGGQRGGGYRMEDFSLQKLTGNDFTTNLTGKDRSGKMCID
jgi:uncharacterized membrane protein